MRWALVASKHCTGYDCIHKLLQGMPSRDLARDYRLANLATKCGHSEVHGGWPMRDLDGGALVDILVF